MGLILLSAGCWASRRGRRMDPVAVGVAGGDTTGLLALQGWACPEPPRVGASRSVAMKDGASCDWRGPSATQ